MHKTTNQKSFCWIFFGWIVFSATGKKLMGKRLSRATGLNRHESSSDEDDKKNASSSYYEDEEVLLKNGS